jgi:Mn2+/Fe2+ NRAMP family transporter
MGDALHLLVPGKVSVFVMGFGAVSLIAVLFVPYSSYVKYLKWLTLSLFAYVGVTIFVQVSWGNVARATLIPHLQLTKESLTALAAVLGTTISPYLFFWQASQEVEEVKNNRGERRAPVQADAQLGRIRVDTYLGMAFSNLVAFFIILTAASTLHAHGITQILTSAEAATALKPLAGRFAFALFACGIVGTGLLAVPVFSGFRRLWHWRSLPVERKPGADAETGDAILCRHLRSYHPWAVAELPAHRPSEGSFLGRRSEWAGFGPANGGNHDYRFQPKSDG